MRACVFLVVSGAASLCLGQAPASTPVPADPNELVTATATARTVERAVALAILNRAQAPMRLLNPMTPPYFMSVSFVASGDPSSSGQGEFTQLWQAQENWSWTAKLGNFSVSRVHTRAGTYDENPVASVPMRVHMVRNAIFWTAQGINATSQFRSVAAEWNGHPITCLLVAERTVPADAPGRQWDESEYCLDSQTTLLQILSIAPGSYTVYSYSGQSFHGRQMPDRFRTYLNGVVVLDANFRIGEPSTAGHPVPQLTEAMIAAGSPTALSDPLKTSVTVPSPFNGTVLVHAQIGPDGKVTGTEISTATDPSLATQALDRAAALKLPGSGEQHQGYFEVRFTSESRVFAVPLAATPNAAASRPTVPVQPYYLERDVWLPPEPSDAPGLANPKEILARRSDGATVRMGTTRVDKTGQYTRQLTFTDGRNVTVYDSVKAKITWPSLGQAQVASNNRTLAPADCQAGQGGTLLGRDQVEGVDVVIVQRTDPSFRMTVWMAPSLGCENLYTKAERMNPNGSFRVTAETKTTKIQIGEPDPRLFQVGPELVEMKPSQAGQLWWDSLHVDLDALGLNALEKAAFLQGLQQEWAADDKRYEKR